MLAAVQGLLLCPLDGAFSCRPWVFPCAKGGNREVVIWNRHAFVGWSHHHDALRMTPVLILALQRKLLG